MPTGLSAEAILSMIDWSFSFCLIGELYPGWDFPFGGDQVAKQLPIYDHHAESPNDWASPYAATPSHGAQQVQPSQEQSSHLQLAQSPSLQELQVHVQSVIFASHVFE